MTGWRLGIAAGPKDIIAGMTKVHQYSIMCSPTMAQYAAIEALRFGEDEVENMRKEYDRRRRFITHQLNRIGLSCFEPHGAFYVFPSVEATGMSRSNLPKNSLKKKMSRCSRKRIRRMRRRIRCVVLRHVPERIREAIQRMARFVIRQ
jgi:aminotransferase